MNENTENRDLHKEVSSYEFLVDIAVGRMLRGIENENIHVFCSREIDFVNSHCPQAPPNENNLDVQASKNSSLRLLFRKNWKVFGCVPLLFNK